MGNDYAWGSDVPVSMPEPIEPSDILLDFGTHVFTPDGMKLNMSAAVRAEVMASAYRPIDKGERP